MDKNQERRNLAIYFRRLANDIENDRYNSTSIESQPIMLPEPSEDEHYLSIPFHLGYKILLEVRY